MPLDSITLGAVCSDIKKEIAGAKIDKIHQPEKYELMFFMRTKSGMSRLLIAATPNDARIHLTEERRENPASAPMFCMLMRKHLQGARVADIRQVGMERVVEIDLDCIDEFGDDVKKKLIVELIGRMANIILVDGEGRIIDLIRRVNSDMSSARPLLPGAFYRIPPPQDKKDIMTIEDGEFFSLFKEMNRDTRLDKWIVENFNGISPLVAREISFRIFGDAAAKTGPDDEDTRALVLKNLRFLKGVVDDKKYTPVILYRADSGEPLEFSFMDIKQYGDAAVSEEAKDFSDLIERFFKDRASKDRIKRRSAGLLKTVTTARDRLARKIGYQMEELRETKSRDELKSRGDIITANLHLLTKGMNKATLIDYYDPEMKEVEVKLDIRLTPQQNAQKYYRDYAKAKSAEVMLTKLIDEGKSELLYLESVLEEIDRAEGERDLAEIREELSINGYLSRHAEKGGKKQKAPPCASPHHYKTAGGFDIYVGRNNRQNEILTLKTAMKSDMWFHVQKMPGAHVILSCEGKTPDNDDMTAAAEIAAFYSNAKNSALVPVDYTAVRHVKKLYGGKTGMVNYENFKTAFVTPDAKKIERIRVK